MSRKLVETRPSETAPDRRSFSGYAAVGEGALMS
jgi:hypothetical protein